jgi:hypothetical protein
MNLNPETAKEEDSPGVTEGNQNKVKKHTYKYGNILILNIINIKSLLQINQYIL